MRRTRSILGTIVLAGTFVLLYACDDGQPSPVEPGDAVFAKGPFEPSLPELPAFCPDDTYERTPEEVLEHQRAALAAGDLDAVYCNHAVDAVVIGDGGIAEGQVEIRAAFAFFNQLYGGTQPQVVQQIVVQVPDDGESFPPAPVFDGPAPTYMVRLLFTIDTPCVTVPDGIDTYFIRSGQIHARTSHAFPVFQCL